MLLPSKEQMNDMRRCALLLEKNSYDGVRVTLKKFNAAEYTIFWRFFLDDDLLAQVARDKDRLAHLLAKSCGVIALPVDRKRIVFSLAKFSDKNLEGINAELVKEFGSYFRLLPRYVVGKYVKDWKEIVARAEEIRSGYLNLANLAVESQVQGMMRYYKMYKQTDPKEINDLHNLAIQILTLSVNMVNLPPTVPETADIMPKIINFYRLTNRLQLDIDKLMEDSSIETPVLYITVANAILELKLLLLKKQQPLNDISSAEKEMRKRFRDDYFEANFLTTEELLRRKMPLPPSPKATNK